jgi:hypothetical protein
MVMVASVADRAGEGAALVAAAMVLFVLREVVFGGFSAPAVSCASASPGGGAPSTAVRPTASAASLRSATDNPGDRGHTDRNGAATPSEGAPTPRSVVLPPTASPADPRIDQESPELLGFWRL